MSDEIQHRHDLSGATIYAIIRDASGDVWNGSAFVAPNIANYGTYDIPLTAAGNDGYRYLADMPAVDAGVYAVEVYEQVGGSPDGAVDRLIGVGEINWDGTAEFTLAQLVSATGDLATFVPAQHSLEAISNTVNLLGTGTSAPSVVANSNSLKITGFETLDYEATASPDGTTHDIAPDGGEIEYIYRFNVGGGFQAAAIDWLGYANSVNDTVIVEANGGTQAVPDWQQIGTIDGFVGSTNGALEFRLWDGHTLSGTDIGEVEIRMRSSTATKLATDQILCQRVLINQSVGYVDGRIWVDEVEGTSGTTAGFHGTADNPVWPWADALILSALTGIKRFHLAAGTTATLTAASDNYNIVGFGGTVALNGQSISGAVFGGVTISGNDDGSNAIEVHYHDCTVGNNTLGLFHMEHSQLTGDLVLAEVGTYLMDACYSGVAGTGSPSVDFGNALGSTNLNIRHQSGGVEIRQFADAGTDTMSLEGWGQLIINANCTAAGTIAMRGHFPITDNVVGGWEAGGGTLIDAARYDVDQVGDAVWDEVLTGATHNISSSAGRRLRGVTDIIIHEGICQAGSTASTIVLDAGASATDGMYDPSVIAIIGGTGSGQSRQILEYNGTTKTAYVNRDWKATPDDTSSFIILSNAGDTHVNEGVAQGATSTTLTLNTLAVTTDEVYTGQILFIVAGTGADQAKRITAYDGATKIATIYGTWEVTPDTTSNYVMLPGSNAAIKDKTDLISIGRMTSVSPVLEDGTIELVAGDDYADGVTQAVVITITSYTGPTLGAGATAELRICTVENYNAGTTTPALTVTDASPSISDSTATFTFELTSAETVTLGTAPPANTLNHMYQLVVITTTGEESTISLNGLTVKERIE